MCGRAPTDGPRLRSPTGSPAGSAPTRWASRWRRTAPTWSSCRRRPTATWAPGSSAPGLRTEPLAAARRKAGGEAIAETALMFLGAPYEWGGVTVHGLDCSGLVQAVHRRFGMLLPHSAAEQETAGREVSLRQASPGDLLCYGDHIAIWLGEGRIVHASSEHGKVVDEPHPAELKARLRTVRRRVRDRGLRPRRDLGRGRRSGHGPQVRAKRAGGHARREHDQGARVGRALDGGRAGRYRPAPACGRLGDARSGRRGAAREHARRRRRSRWPISTC